MRTELLLGSDSTNVLLDFDIQSGRLIKEVWSIVLLTFCS
jgi:hypothetical protein